MPATGGPIDANAVGDNAGISWGTNGHPMHGGSPYVPGTTSFATQFGLVVGLGLTHYRVDYDSDDSDHFTSLTALVAAAAGTGVTIVPVLNPDPISGSYATEAAAYAFGRAQALNYATNYPSIKVWEIGNEYETRLTTPPTGQGSFISNYVYTEYVRMRGLVRGLFEGIRAGNPAAKVAFGSAGGGGWGIMDQLWADGIRWDISVEHFYSDGGTVDIRHLFLVVGETDKLALLRDKYHKPIWMTEFNYWNTADSPPSKSTMATYLSTTMATYDGFAKTYGLEGVAIYELLDELQFGSVREAGFGLVTSGSVNAAGTAVATYLAAHPSVTYDGGLIAPPAHPFVQPPPLGTSTGTSDALAITPIPPLDTLGVGTVYIVQAPNSANATTTPAITITGRNGSFGAKTIKKRTSTALAANDILANMYLQLLWDGTSMILLNPVVN